jgi:stage II sporulation protein D
VRIGLAVILVGAYLLAGLARVQAQTELRILLLRHQLQSVVASAGGLIVRPYPSGTAPLLTPDITTVIDVHSNADGLVLAGSIQTQAEVLISPLTDVPITLDGQEYRGSILLIRDNDNSLRVIDVVELEQYLYSVVGSEVAASTPASALQAQAVVARTYAVAHLGAHEDLGFDLRAGDADQAYNGVAAESAPVVDAVDATRGVVMVYGNQLADAYYSACDGGYTSDGHALNDPQPYLQAVRDPYCPFSPYMSWSADVPAPALIEALQSSGDLPPTLSSQSIDDVRAGQADTSGRLLSVQFVAGHRAYDVPATRFRFAAGTRLVKSTRIRGLSYSSGVVHVSGAGFGHGVGMCQLGAAGMAQTGLGVYAILNFYYPGALLTQLASYQRLMTAQAAQLRIASRR